MKHLLNRPVLLMVLIVGVYAGALRAAKGQVFEEVPIGLIPMRLPSVAWGDYDGDGRLDILLAGMTSSSRITQIWHNTGSGFSNINAGLPGVDTGKALWGDYDNDGKLDILLMGNSDAGPILQIWRNTGTSFSNINAGLPAVSSASAAWGDFDNDGKIDLVLAGATGLSTGIAQVWRNTGDGSFSNINAGLSAVRFGVVKWIDYDNDGWLDILLLAQTGDSTQQTTELWRNTGHGFTKVDVGLSSTLFHYGAAIGDYDNDGWLDLFLAGKSNLPVVPYSQLWRNSGTRFEYVNAGVSNMFNPFCAWGDYDNDGRSDLLMTGDIGVTTAVRRSYVFRNTTSGFTNVGAGLPGISSGSAAWGDYDNDGKLDIILAGQHGDGPSTPLAQVWRNLTATSNSPPIAPDGLTSQQTPFGVQLRWDAGGDAETPTAGLNYNLRVGTTPGGYDIVSPQAASNGFRFVPELGNRQMTRFAILTNLLPGKYYWSVQTIDTTFAGSPFAPEQAFVIQPAIVRFEFTAGGSQLHLVCRGHPKAGYTIESSPDLKNWSDGRNLTAGVDGSFEDTEDVIGGSPALFYRLRQL